MNKTLKSFFPPILFYLRDELKKKFPATKTLKPTELEDPKNLQRCIIHKGRLAGRPIFLNPDAQEYQNAMLQGTYDDFLFSYIDKQDWQGKIIYDVGAHIGYHSLQFSDRVNDKGHVYAFEPHPLHLNRLELNFSANPDLQPRVSIMPVALSNKIGQVSFFISNEIEGSRSSSSYIEGSSTPYKKSWYEDFLEISVESECIDNLVINGTCPPPDLIKIDVEGAETQVIEGAIEVLKQHHPLLVIEVHSIKNMYNLMNKLPPVNYIVSILNEDHRRSFISAEFFVPKVSI